MSSTWDQLGNFHSDSSIGEVGVFFISLVRILWPPVLLVMIRYPAHWLRIDTLLRRMTRRRRKKKGS